MPSFLKERPLLLEHDFHDVRIGRPSAIYHFLNFLTLVSDRLKSDNGVANVYFSAFRLLQNRWEFSSFPSLLSESDGSAVTIYFPASFWDDNYLALWASLYCWIPTICVALRKSRIEALITFPLSFSFVITYCPFEPSGTPCICWFSDKG